MEEAVQKEFNKLKNLVQYKQKDEKYIERKAIEKVKKRELEVETLFQDEEEKKRAVDLFGKYLSHNSFENISDLNTLKTLVFNEVFQIRLQRIINVITVDSKIIPDKQIKALIDCQKQISQLKEELGLNKDDSDKSDAYKALEMMIKKFKIYQKENRDEFISKCPCCKEIIMWNRRIKEYEAKKHPLLKNNKPYNNKIVKLIKEKKITEKDAAEILETSETNIRYIMQKNI